MQKSWKNEIKDIKNHLAKPSGIQKKVFSFASNTIPCHFPKVSDPGRISTATSVCLVSWFAHQQNDSKFTVNGADHNRHKFSHAFLGVQTADNAKLWIGVVVLQKWLIELQLGLPLFRIVGLAEEAFGKEENYFFPCRNLRKYRAHPEKP